MKILSLKCVSTDEAKVLNYIKILILEIKFKLTFSFHDRFGTALYRI